MLDLGCYAVCAARWFHGVEPVRALAAGAWDPLSGIDTHLCGTLVFPGERYAMLDTTWRAWFRQEYDLLGTKGGIRVDRCFVALDGEHEILLRQGDEFKTVTVAGDDPYRLEMEHFCRAVRGQEALLYGRDDALANAAVLDALLASAAEGRPVEVSVPTPQAG
jgi:predicted dehydrogenase